jgi:cell division protein ZapD
MSEETIVNCPTCGKNVVSDGETALMARDLRIKLVGQIETQAQQIGIFAIILDSEYGIVPERFDFELACC